MMTEARADWYDALVTDCKAIITERVYRSRQEIIECWHEVGERIATDANYQKHAKGNLEMRRQFADDLGSSLTTLYQAIQFYERYPVLSDALETFPEGKNISWRKITRLYLPSDRPAEPTYPEVERRSGMDRRHGERRLANELEKGK